MVEGEEGEKNAEMMEAKVMYIKAAWQVSGMEIEMRCTYMHAFVRNQLQCKKCCVCAH